jgi:hypothetical protein
MLKLLKSETLQLVGIIMMPVVVIWTCIVATPLALVTGTSYLVVMVLALNNIAKSHKNDI